MDEADSAAAGHDRVSEPAPARELDRPAQSPRDQIRDLLHVDCHLTVPWYLNVLEAHAEIDALTSTDPQ